MIIASLFDSGIRRSAYPPHVTTAEGGRIFVVDDEASIVELLVAALRRIGYSVDMATDSRTALALISAHPESYDVLITDQDMPHLTGVELIQRLKQAGFAGKVVIHSGSLHGNDASLMRAMSADALLHKPAPVASVVSVTRMLMKQTKPC